MVEHRLAKARVASSNLVSRFKKTLENTMFSGVLTIPQHYSYWMFYPLNPPKIIGIAVKIAVNFEVVKPLILQHFQGLPFS